MTELQLEISEKFYDPDESIVSPDMMITPPLGGDNWVFRVKLNEKQAIVGLKKFMTIGIGFLVEEDDWNLNLPWSRDILAIWEHIESNKSYDDIDDEDCIRAIGMIQSAVEDHKEELGIL